MLRNLTLILVLPVAVAVAWLSLGDRGERADFVFSSEEPRTLDPHRVSWMTEIQIASAMFEGLTRLSAHTLQPEPAVAETWEFDPATLTYTFHLRPDARWSNGDAVTAHDFRYSWLRCLSPQAASQYAALLFVVKGAGPYYRSRLNESSADDEPPETVGVNFPDDRTLAVTLAGPCPYFLDLTSFPTFSPVHPATIERWKHADHLWTRPGNMVSNGAFVLSDWEFKRRILLANNPHYWQKDRIGVRTLEAFITADPNVALTAYEAGRVHLVRGLSTSVARVLARAQAAGRRSDFQVGDRFSTYFFRVNCRRPPFDNPDLRKALSLAIDRPAICEHVMGLGEKPANTYVPTHAIPLMPRRTADGRTIYYDPPAGLGADMSYEERLELAREHLRRSGFNLLASSRPVRLSYAANPDYQRVSEAVQAMWERGLGIRVELQALEGKVLSSRIRDLDYDVARSDWYGDYMDPGTFLDMFTSDSGQNRTGWSHAGYDDLILRAARERNDARRYEMLAEAERILCEAELPIIPIFYRTGNFLLNPAFTNLRDDVLDLLLIQWVQPKSTAMKGTFSR